MVPLAFWTARELHMSRTASTFAAAMVLMDNAYLVISRYILLDSMLLSSICFVVLCLTKFRNLRDRYVCFCSFKTEGEGGREER